MAETLRELVVSLSLSSDNFNANLKSVNQRIREAESNFKLASAGVDGFENTMRGAATQFSALKQKLDLQNKAVEQHEQKLQAANKALDKSRDSAAKQASSLVESKLAHTALTAEIAKAEAAHKASAKATGDNSEQTVALGVKVLDLKDKEKALADEIKNGEGKLEAATKSVQRNENAVSRAQAGLNNAKAKVKETTSALDKLSSGLGKVGAGLGALATKAIAAGESMSAMGKKLSTRVTAPLMALGAYAFKAAVDFESAFAGVRKTVNATEEEFTQLEQSVKDMSLEVPSNTTVIAGVMEAAGQLGIATENLEDYTRTMIDLGNSTNLAAEEAATAIAKFSNITGMSQGDVGKFGSALVDLGNNFATTERDIMNMATRLAAAGSQVGMTDTQILAFATGLSSVGIEAEAGGTAFSKAMIQMEVAVATGSDALDDFAKVSGMSKKEFVEAWKAEPAAAIEAFIVGLSKMDEAGISAIATLEDMGISEVRLRDTLLRATNATELFANAQTMAADAWADGTALSAEAEQRYNTMASQLEILKNRVSLAAQSLGQELVPMAKRVIEAVSGLIDRFMALDTEQKEQIIKWAAIAAAVGPALLILGKITSGAGKTIQAILGISRALKGLGAVNLGWIGLAVAGVAGLAVAIKALQDASPSLDKTLDKVFNRSDQETLDRFNVAFEAQITTTVTADDYQTKINTAIDNIKLALTSIEGLSETEQAQVLQAISAGSGIDVFKQALVEMEIKPGKAAEITATYDAAMTEISTALGGLALSAEAQNNIIAIAAAGGDVEAALVGYGVDPVAAATVASRITGAMTTVSTALDGLGLTDTAKAKIVEVAAAGGDVKAALIEYGVAPEKAVEIAGQITGAMSFVSTSLTGLGLDQSAVDAIAAVAAAGGDVEAALVEYGVDPLVADAVAGEITGSMSKIDAAIKLLGLSPEDAEALKAGALSDRRLIGIALKLMGAPQDVVDSVLAGYDTVAGSMTGKITGLLDEVAAALTDGKPDDPKTMAALEKKFREYFQGAVDLVNQWAAEEIAKLDVTSETYDADVANIQTKAGEMRTAIEGQQTAALSFLSTMAGKSAEEVRARLGELAEVEEAVQAILAEIEAANVAANEQGAQASKITKKGSARDVETAGRAFGYETRTHQSTMDALEAQYQADLVALEAKFDELGEDEYKRESKALADKYAADTAEALDAYGISINELLLGLGQSLEAMSPELAAAIQQAIDAKKLQGEVQGAIDQLSAGELDASTLTDGVLQAIKDTTGIDWTAADLMAMSPEDAAGLLEGAKTAIETAATTAFEGIELDAGWIDEALKGALEGGTFDGLDGLDMSTAQGKMEALFKPVGESAGTGLAAGVDASADKATSAVETMAGGLEGTARGVLRSKSPSQAFAAIGDDIVSGLVSGVNRSTWRLKFAMVAMAQAAIKAAKGALGIASPSKLFRDEVGAMMVRGIAVGVESETEQQRRAIANAARQMTASARDGVRAETSRIVNDGRNQSINVNIDNVNAGSKQDIETLAQRLSALNLRRSRGYGY